MPSFPPSPPFSPLCSFCVCVFFLAEALYFSCGLHQTSPSCNHLLYVNEGSAHTFFLHLEPSKRLPVGHHYSTPFLCVDPNHFHLLLVHVQFFLHMFISTLHFINCFPCSGSSGIFKSWNVTQSPFKRIPAHSKKFQPPYPLRGPPYPLPSQSFKPFFGQGSDPCLGAL